VVEQGLDNRTTLISYKHHYNTMANTLDEMDYDYELARWFDTGEWDEEEVKDDEDDFSWSENEEESAQDKVNAMAFVENSK